MRSNSLYKVETNDFSFLKHIKEASSSKESALKMLQAMKKFGAIQPLFFDVRTGSIYEFSDPYDLEQLKDLNSVVVIHKQSKTRCFALDWINVAQTSGFCFGFTSESNELFLSSEGFKSDLHLNTELIYNQDLLRQTELSLAYRVLKRLEALKYPISKKWIKSLIFEYFALGRYSFTCKQDCLQVFEKFF